MYVHMKPTEARDMLVLAKNNRYTCMYVCIRYTCMCVCMYMIYMYVCVYVCMYVCTGTKPTEARDMLVLATNNRHTCMCVCMCVCMLVCIKPTEAQDTIVFLAKMCALVRLSAATYAGANSE